jgi:hypothetical protein
MKAFSASVAILIAMLAAPISLSACSVAGCSGDGIELRRTFAVRVTHDGKPLAGVSVTAREFSKEDVVLKTTDLHGTALFANLSPGEYWLDSDLLGISAGSQCFHVAESPSAKAKGKITYDWGDLAPSVRQASGRLVESEPGPDGTPLQRVLHRVDVPISGVKLKLTNPLTGSLFEILSDIDGRFSFGEIPQGTYVLRIEGHGAGNKFDFATTDLVVKIGPSAKPDQLSLEAGPSGCGGKWVALRDQLP